MASDDGRAEGAEAPSVPTCYRHPDRETYVSCTRCERHICPDCMRDAAVGHQCPECVAEGNKGMRAARTVFGGKATVAPYATWFFLGLMLLGHVVQLVAGPAFTGTFALNPWRAILYGDWYTLITSAFLHGSVMHLAFNAFALYIVGRQLEAWLGHVRYIALWVLSALGGSALTVVWAVAGPWLTAAVTSQSPQIDVVQTVGASGAIFGLFGAVLLAGRRLNLDTRFILGLLVVNLAITFLVPGISWTGHIGGLVTGLALGAVYAFLPRKAGRSRNAVHTAAWAGWLVLLAVLTAVAAAAGTSYVAF